MESEFHRELRRPHALGGNRVRIESARMYYAETIERAQKFSLKIGVGTIDPYAGF